MCIRDSYVAGHADESVLAYTAVTAVLTDKGVFISSSCKDYHAIIEHIKPQTFALFAIRHKTVVACLAAYQSACTIGAECKSHIVLRFTKKPHGTAYAPSGFYIFCFYQEFALI